MAALCCLHGLRLQYLMKLVLGLHNVEIFRLRIVPFFTPPARHKLKGYNLSTVANQRCKRDIELSSIGEAIIRVLTFPALAALIRAIAN